MQRTVWGLPQAGILANKLLHKRLMPHGYYKCANTPGLWKHITCQILFTLVVDNFGGQYVGKKHKDHLIWCIKKAYNLTKDWSGNLYCGITLDWDNTAHALDISLPGYIKNSCKNTNLDSLQKFNIVNIPWRPSSTEQMHKPPPNGFFSHVIPGKNISHTTYHRQHLLLCSCSGHHLPHGTKFNSNWTNKRDKEYNGKSKTTSGLSCIKPQRKNVIQSIRHDNECPLGHVIPFRNTHLQQSLRTFFHGFDPDWWQPHQIKRCIFTLCAILRFVIASAAKAKLGALFLNCKEGMIFRMALKELGHPQPKTPVHCDNAMAIGIANNTIKRQH